MRGHIPDNDSGDTISIIATAIIAIALVHFLTQSIATFDSSDLMRIKMRIHRVERIRRKEAESMTHAQRNAEILKILEENTKRATVSKAAARGALIGEGIYTKKGQLRVEFGGKPKKETVAA